MIKIGREHNMSFGVISDIQYANASNGTNYARTRERYYRHSLTQLQHAIDIWLENGANFAVNLGDAIDGRCKRDNDSESALRTVLDEFERFQKPVYHIWGNHEFYNFKRSTLMEIEERFYSAAKDNVHRGSEDSLYFHFEAFPKFRIVVVDAFAYATLGHDKDSETYKEAYRGLRKVNSNADLNSADGIPLNEARFVEYNGALGEAQLVWLESVLTHADANDENVLILTHVPFYHKATDYFCICWDAEKILEVLHKHKSAFAVFGGHDHDGGYAVDEMGIHHVTFHGVIETEPGSQAFAIVRLKDAGVQIEGFGRVPSRFLPFRQR